MQSILGTKPINLSNITKYTFSQLETNTKGMIKM